jgi:hypothetical protein
MRLVILVVAAGFLWALFQFLQSKGLGSVATALAALYVTWSADTILGHNAQIRAVEELRSAPSDESP